MFHEHDTVVIRSLLTATRQVIGTRGICRQPQIGDVGTVVDCLAADRCIVECTNSEGDMLWFADFWQSELAAEPANWEFTVDEISAGIYRALGVGPDERRVGATEMDPSLALAKCREFAMGSPCSS